MPVWTIGAGPPFRSGELAVARETPVSAREETLLPAQRALGSASTAPDRSVEATLRLGAAWFEVWFVFVPNTRVRLRPLYAGVSGGTIFFGWEKSPLPAGSVSIEAISITYWALFLWNSTRSRSELALS